MNINLHIERLIVDGVPLAHGQGPLVKAAVEAELTRLLAANGLNGDFLSGGAVPSAKAAGIHVTNDNHPAELGHQIARAVYGSIGK